MGNSHLILPSRTIHETICWMVLPMTYLMSSFPLPAGVSYGVYDTWPGMGAVGGVGDGAAVLG